MKPNFSMVSSDNQPNPASGEIRSAPAIPARDGCCIDISIASPGDVIIYNCTTAAHDNDDCSAPDDPVCPPTATGACVPVSLGAKPKQSRRRKLDKLLANTLVPSTLGTSFMALARRALAGKAPANAIEERAFATLRGLSPDLRRVLACALDSFDSLAAGERDRLFSSAVPHDVDDPLDPEQLTQAFAEEVLQNVAVTLFGDPGCITEHPGQLRTPPFPGGEHPSAPVRICRINGLRTGQFAPQLSPGDYTPDELQHQCEIVLEGGTPTLVCKVQTTDCPGSSNHGTCLRVQEVEAGSSVLLEGVNFSSVNTKVQLHDVAASTVVGDFDAHVCGDDETPRTEIIDGIEVLITDCRVHDRLTFRLPDDLLPGLYDLVVLVPNEGGDPGWGEVVGSNGVRGITVVAPSTARFQIASETLHCREETSPARFGSDEVGLKILAAPLFLDLTGGEVQTPNGGDPIRFGDVDSGDSRALNHLLFTHQQPIAGAALTIMGFEVDGEDAFKQQIDSFTEAFVDVLKDELSFLLAHLKEAEQVAGKLASSGWAGLIAGSIAVTVVLAIDAIIALWAPADLIIEDTIGPTTLDLLQLTSAHLPLPQPSEHTTPGGLNVKITPLEMIPQQYREKREYISDDEDSSYEITLRYNRVA